MVLLLGKDSKCPLTNTMQQLENNQGISRKML